MKAANRGGMCLIPVWLLDLYICDDNDDDDVLLSLARRDTGGHCVRSGSGETGQVVG